MPFYRKKPVVIQAIVWESVNAYDGVERYFVDDSKKMTSYCEHCGRSMFSHGWIKTLEGGHIVCPGDFVITGVEGEKYPCKPHIFHRTYERVGNETF